MGGGLRDDINQLEFLLVEYLNPYFDFAGNCQGLNCGSHFVLDYDLQKLEDCEEETVGT